MRNLSTLNPLPLRERVPEGRERGLSTTNPSPTIATQWSPLSLKGREL